MKLAMRLSLGVGFAMLLMKIFAYFITGSVAILSDAAESIVHVLAVSFAAYSLSLSLKPPDPSHPYGHDRISFFSAGFEGAMIVGAAVYIMYESIHKWIHGLELENLGIGIVFVVLATVINGILGCYLVRQGKRYHSFVLVANGKHVLTDSWTSLGVIVALILTMVTRWLPFDPIIAIAVALNILWSGFRLVRQSVGGLMDETDPKTNSTILEILEKAAGREGVAFHDLRHRNAGNKLLIEFHLLFPSHTPISRAHEQATRIELELVRAFPMQTQVTTHLEPIEGHDAAHAPLEKAQNEK